MPIGSALSGLRAGFTEKIVLDAGVAYANANITKMLLSTISANFAFAVATDPVSTWTDPNGDTVAPRKLGATRGGMKINLGKTERQVEVDGRRFPIKGINRIDMMDLKVGCALLEMADTETLRLAIGTSILTDKQNFEVITPYLYESNTDYLGNISIFATISGKTAPNGNPLPICVVLENCKALNIQEITFADKSEAVLQLDLVAHALDSAAFDCPLKFIVPKALEDLYY